jgi:hypothetical protein
VTGVDIASNAILIARERARAENLDAAFDEGDAELLPYPNASFDVVTSLFGAMFAPRPDLVARELLRVCRPGGIIAMANWTKTGFIGQTFAVYGRFIAPPGMPAPVLWGDEPTVRERFGTDVSDLRMTRVMYRFDYPFQPAQVVDFFATITDRLTERSMPYLLASKRPCTTTSFASGRRTICRTTPHAPPWTPNTSMSWPCADNDTLRAYRSPCSRIPIDTDAGSQLQHSGAVGQHHEDLAIQPSAGARRHEVDQAVLRP